MSLNENSTRKDILNWIKTDPFYFLHNFSDKSWAQLYIDTARRLAAKKDPYDFMDYFSDEPWANPYLHEAAKKLQASLHSIFWVTSQISLGHSLI